MQTKQGSTRVILDIPGLTLRPFRLSDAPPLVAYLSEPEIVQQGVLGRSSPLTLEDVLEWIDESLDPRHPCLDFAIVVGGSLAGGVHLHASKVASPMGPMFIGFWIGQPYRKRGFATRAVQAVTEYALHDLHEPLIHAEVLPENRGSRRVLEKAGYQFERSVKECILPDQDEVDMFIYVCKYPKTC